jgi:glutaminyl-peptide cyclotransferase
MIMHQRPTSKAAHLMSPPGRLAPLGLAALVAALVAVAGLSACRAEGTVAPTETALACPPGAGDVGAGSEVERLRVDVLEERPHDPAAFTQGLLVHEGSLYESTGMYGSSTVREVIPETGEVIDSTALHDDEFGEGLARVGDRLYQITWREQVAHVYDIEGLEPIRELPYDGEGWGLCYDGRRLVMSDGSSTLTFRDPDTFEALGHLAVSLNGAPVERLNELECVGDAVYANVWQTDEIVKIDSATGEVRAVVDASGIMPEARLAGHDPGNAVLNGIAYDPERNLFYISGKWWPSLFEACIVPAGNG